MKYVGSIAYDDVLKNEDASLIIYGAGYWGGKIYNFLRLNGMADRVVCFIDEEKCHCNMDSKPIYNVETAVEKFPTADYLIGGNNMKEMYQELRKHFIKNIHLLIR